MTQPAQLWGDWCWLWAVCTAHTTTYNKVYLVVNNTVGTVHKRYNTLGIWSDSVVGSDHYPFCSCSFSLYISECGICVFSYTGTLMHFYVWAYEKRDATLRICFLNLKPTPATGYSSFASSSNNLFHFLSVSEIQELMRIICGGRWTSITSLHIY